VGEALVWAGGRIVFYIYYKGNGDIANNQNTVKILQRAGMRKK